MRHPHATRRKRNISPGERYSYKRSPRKVGTAAVRKSIVVSESGHTVGLQRYDGTSSYDHPDDLSSLQPEQLAAQVLGLLDVPDSVHSPALTGRQLGKLFLESIDEENDSETIIALKQLGAKICGIVKNNVDYQQIITTLDATLSADDLRDFITYIHEWSHEDATDTEEYVDAHMNELSGFRVEASFMRLAHEAGFKLQPATRYEDHRGIDVWVNDVPFDLKSSERIAKYHTAKHKNDTNRSHAVKFVPPITAEDFDGRLVVPYEKVKHILATTNFTSMINDGITRYNDANTSQKSLL